ncbi:MAG TPA: hypothetical protein VGO40_20440 [Longimicrobium sp.]|jgi:hypothetical protein|nr:hypothetical protein [Longimicrobium sp.]
MAEKTAGSSGASSNRSGSKVPRDAFISRLVPDPKNVGEPPEVLRGFVGDSDEDGYTRIYCGPGLDAFADVRDEDILHYEPARDGGEHTLWARPGAQVKYGQRGGPKSAASGFIDGPLLSDYSGGGGAAEAGPIGRTGWRGCAQATHLIGCTGYLGCGHGTIHPTIWTQIGCGTHAGCIPTVGLGCPNTISCPPQGGGPEALAAAAPVGPTGWQGCVQPTHLLGCPNTSTCTPQTYMPGCPNTSTCTPQTHLLGCPNTSTCTPGGGAVAEQSTAATLCTRYGCHPRTLATVCTQVGCHPGGTAATVCTHYGCPGPATYQPACTLGFTCTYVGCPY